MQKGKPLKIAALAAVVVFGLGVLIYGLVSGFGFGDFFSTIDDGVYKVPYVYDEKTEKLHSIDVSWQSGPVSIALYDGSAVRVTETAKKDLKTDERLTLELEGGALTVRWSSAVFNLALRSRPKQLTVEIPRQFAGDLERVAVKTASGKVSVASLAMQEGVFETVSGDIDLSAVTAETLRLSTASGEIAGDALTAAKTLYAGSVSGDVQLTGTKTGKLTLDSTSGGIEAAVEAEEIHAGNVSGDVRLWPKAWPKTCEISTVSGSVQYTAGTPEAGFACTFSTVSGTFDSDFPVQKAGSTYVHGGGTHLLEISTTSGGAEILKAP